MRSLLDYLIRAVELDAISHGTSAASLYEGDYYNFENEVLKASYTSFAAETGYMSVKTAVYESIYSRSVFVFLFCVCVFSPPYTLSLSPKLTYTILS